MESMMGLGPSLVQDCEEADDREDDQRARGGAPTEHGVIEHSRILT